MVFKEAVFRATRGRQEDLEDLDRRDFRVFKELELKAFRELALREVKARGARRVFRDWKGCKVLLIRVRRDFADSRDLQEVLRDTRETGDFRV